MDGKGEARDRSKEKTLKAFFGTVRDFTSHATDEAQISAGPSRVAGSYLSGA
jgi:hypothetical protein